MKLNEGKITEVLLGIILIILLVITISLFLKTPNNTAPTTITNSFNNNYYNTPQRDYQQIKDRDYLDYDYHAYKKKSTGILGNDIEDYTVYVKNQDYKGGSFRVKYYFTDYYGDTETETMTYYIPPRKSKKFSYKNIHKYKFHDWHYEVISRTSI